MLVQRLPGSLRLVAQHDHALLSGELARAWRGLGAEPEPLPLRVVLAVSLHDVAWIEADRVPRLNPATGLPHDFVSLPLGERLPMYRSGIERLAALDRYAGLLASLHYSTLEGTAGVEPFQSREAERRRALREELGAGAAGEEALRTHLALLKLFDNLSLYLLLASPEVDPRSRPSWLDPARFARTPDGAGLDLRWTGPARLVVDPFPFAGPVAAAVPFREVAGEGFRDPEGLARAWAEARPGEVRVLVLPPAGGHCSP